ncbi:hypothetical protein [Rothia nasimurium]|uniref:hypothetical protein n=1 Tax=Rothia nasimurium TaxID=85336 RepID=UPI001F2CDBB0|nr:hypothetical protein [Rothia nasimurium]
MADYGGATPHIGIPYKGNDSPATIDDDNEAAYLVIDAKLAELEARIAARETIFATHEGDGTWAFTDGLGEPVAVNDAGDGDWQVLP